MAINLDGIVLYDAEISVVGKDAVFVRSSNQNLLTEGIELRPFNTYRVSNSQIVIWTGGTDAIAVAERIAMSWEYDGFKINRIVLNAENRTAVQSFVLA